MQLIDILILAIIIMVCFQFWQLRKQTEAAYAYAEDYCQRNQIQFIALSRKKTRIKLFKRKLIEWQTQFDLEFSGNGEDASQGLLYMEDMRLINITTEAYKMN